MQNPNLKNILLVGIVAVVVMCTWVNLGKTKNESLENNLSTQAEKPRFLSPLATDRWVQGENHTISWNTPLPYESHCANTVVAININTGESFVVDLPEKNSTELTWDARTATDGSCGTGNNSVDVPPGMYKLVLQEEDTNFGMGKPVEFESEPFSIMVNQKELDQYSYLIPKIKSYYSQSGDDIRISQKLKLPDDQDMLLVLVGQGPAVSESTLFLLKDKDIEPIDVQGKDGKKSPVSLMWGASGNYSFGDAYSSMDHAIIKAYREFSYEDGDIDGKATLTKCDIGVYVWDSEKGLFVYSENRTNYQKNLDCNLGNTDTETSGITGAVINNSCGGALMIDPVTGEPMDTCHSNPFGSFEMKIINDATHVEKLVTADSAGKFRVELAPGNYTIKKGDKYNGLRQQEYHAEVKNGIFSTIEMKFGYDYP